MSRLVGNRLRCQLGKSCNLECADVLRRRPAVSLPGPGPERCGSMKMLGDRDGRWLLVATQLDASADWELFVAPVERR